MIKKAILLTVLANIIWGANTPIMKLALIQVPVFSLAFIRMFFASLILGLIILFSKNSRDLYIKKEDYKKFIYCALFGVTINLALYFIGLKYTQAIIASFLVAAVPIFTMISAHFYLKEKFKGQIIAASAIALIGVILIIGKPEGHLTLLQIIGDLLLLASTASWIIYEIVSKKLLKVYTSTTVCFYSMAIGAVTLLPFFLIEIINNSSWISQLNSKSFVAILYGIFFASIIAYLAWQKALSILPAGQAAFYFYLDPISGAALSIILLGEKLTPSLILGGILITIAVLISEKHRQNHPLFRASEDHGL